MRPKETAERKRAAPPQAATSFRNQAVFEVGSTSLFCRVQKTMLRQNVLPIRRARVAHESLRTVIPLIHLSDPVPAYNVRLRRNKNRSYLSVARRCIRSINNS